MVHLPAAERISLTLRQPPGADKTIQAGHAIIEALNKLGKSRAFMPYLGNEHCLVDSGSDAKLFHRGCNMRKPARS
jgi:hypothetical protein